MDGSLKLGKEALARVYDALKPRTILVSDFDNTVLGGYYHYYMTNHWNDPILVSTLIKHDTAVQPKFEHEPMMYLGSLDLLTGGTYSFHAGIWTVLLYMQTIVLGYDLAICTGHLNFGEELDRSLSGLNLAPSGSELKDWTRSLWRKASQFCKDLELVSEHEPEIPDTRFHVLEKSKRSKGPEVRSMFDAGEYDRCLFLDDSDFRLQEVQKEFDAAGKGEHLHCVNAAPEAMQSAHEFKRILSSCPGTTLKAYETAIEFYWNQVRATGKYDLIPMQESNRLMSILNEFVIEMDDPTSPGFRMRPSGLSEPVPFIVPKEWSRSFPSIGIK